jgi:aspartyl-tRNA(Asn)/glutamyl-tRNA(Gln) amidotransferase subunit A
MTPATLWQLDARTIADQVCRGELSAVEVVSSYLDRATRVNSHTHAFLTLAADNALEAARHLDHRRAGGERLGPLAGVPVGIKDLIATAGLRTTFGSLAYRDFVPDEHDIVVERLLAADAILLGKTNTTEFGYSASSLNKLGPPTRNPWKTNLTSGGSSAGSASAVASGACPVAIGSDGGGSIRVPAALCGLVGFKPSLGVVPAYPGCRDERYPGVSSWELLEHLGPITRTVADAALVMSVLAGPDDRDRLSLPQWPIDWTGCLDRPVGRLRVAYSPTLGYLSVEPAVTTVIERVVGLFASELECRVEEAHPGWDDPADTFARLIALDTDLIGLRRLADAMKDDMCAYTRWFCEQPWTAEHFTDALTARKALYNRLWRFFRGYDLLVTPTVAVPAFPADSEGPTRIAGRSVRMTDWFAFNPPFNMSGCPAISVPAGWTPDGLPVGIQLVAARYRDDLVLRVAAEFERLCPWAQRWPAL